MADRFERILFADEEKVRDALDTGHLVALRPDGKVVKLADPTDVVLLTEWYKAHVYASGPDEAELRTRLDETTKHDVKMLAAIHKARAILEEAISGNA